MDELAPICTPAWTLWISSANVDRSLKMLEHTLAARNKPLPISTIRFGSRRALQTVELDSPYFFENSVYEFEFCFDEALVDLSYEPRAMHPLTRINTQFLFHKRYEKALLRGQVDFQNHVGRWTLPIRYKLRSGQMVDDVFECMVHATKLDIESDYRELSTQIDRTFPLWRYSLNALTDGSEGKGRQGPHFPLLWLKRFESLHEELADGVRRVLNAPHNRLIETVRWKKPAQIKGALSPRQEERVKEGLKAGHFERRYAITEKRLHVDTMENRFVKMVVAQVCRHLKRFESELTHADGEQETFSEAFLNQIGRWKEPFETNLNHPLFREVGEFPGHDAGVAHLAGSRRLRGGLSMLGGAQTLLQRARARRCGWDQKHCAALRGLVFAGGQTSAGG